MHTGWPAASRKRDLPKIVTFRTWLKALLFDTEP